ncbi:MAG: hypothetical protein AMS21_04580 [Gemmatimonas sp. SG8_38_2]|nr:MAG: hypothetical protein AMS21_04580 [Gemmatimonas sp. SG8_38_2]
MSDELEPVGEGLLERGIESVFERLAPLSVGAVVSGVAVIGASALLRRVLGSRKNLLGWAGAVALLPIAFWLASERAAHGDREGASDEGDAPLVDEETSERAEA